MSKSIPNINIGQVYDQKYEHAELHFEHLDNLANFFGRNMPVHHHDRFYQLHVILSGETHVHLDANHYSFQGITLFFTPPATPHSFVTDQYAKGYVLTIQQQLVWRLLDLESGISSIMLDRMKPLCTKLRSDNPLLQHLSMLSKEMTYNQKMKDKAVHSLLQLVLIGVIRLMNDKELIKGKRKVDVSIFHKFNALIEEHYTEHWGLDVYASELGISTARLNDICRRVSGLSSKKIVIDRTMQEARRLLQLTSKSVSEIGYELGFKDPAYFARFFRKYADVTASEFRSSNTDKGKSQA